MGIGVSTRGVGSEQEVLGQARINQELMVLSK